MKGHLHRSALIRRSSLLCSGVCAEQPARCFEYKIASGQYHDPVQEYRMDFHTHANYQVAPDIGGGYRHYADYYPKNDQLEIQQADGCKSTDTAEVS